MFPVGKLLYCKIIKRSPIEKSAKATHLVVLVVKKTFITLDSDYFVLTSLKIQSKSLLTNVYKWKFNQVYVFAS